MLKALAISVLLIGDSITFGTMSGNGGASYADSLAVCLGEKFKVVNAGCGGASSLDWTLTFPGTICGGVGILPDGLFSTRVLPNLPSRMAVVMLGTNDAIGYLEPQPVAVETYRLALNEIISNLQDRHVKSVVLMTPPDHAWSDPAARNRLVGYRDQVLKACSRMRRVFCGPDVFELLDLESDFDGNSIHPNAAGHQKIAGALCQWIKENRA